MFSKDMLLEHLQILSSDTYEGRKTGTNGSKKARTYIIKQFQNFDVKPLDTLFEQNFNFSYANKDYQGTNILGTVKGTSNPDKYIVISAHYDHLGIQNNIVHNGADDNASGVSALIAFAEYFKKFPPRHSVILAAFDAEELGLEGSKYYVNNPIVATEKLVFNINMDMISRSNKKELFMVRPKDSELLNNALREVKQSSKDILLTFGHDGTDGLEDWTYASDHASFYRKQIPFLYLGVADHKDYHKHTDDFENIHPDFYKEAVHQIILMFNSVDQIAF
ncbi:M28 family peptidase [Hyunsoonleella flava]|nr:M28 family peptidase [Hyunsoonleella flava]